MQMSKKITVAILAFVTILASLCLLPGFQEAQAYMYTSVQSGQIELGGPILGKYGCCVGYDATGGATNDRSFFPSLEVKCADVSPYESCRIDVMEMTVTGTKPNGQPISGNELTPLSHIISPGTTDLGAVLAKIYPYIEFIDPIGLSELVTLGTDTSGSYFDGFVITDGYDANSAWTNYQGYPHPWSENCERGYQFRFKLHCDPSLGGTYTLNIHYFLRICFTIPEVGGFSIEKNIYDTVTYEFTPPHVYSITGSGFVSGYGEIWDTTNMLGYEADGDIAVIGTYPGSAGYISGRMNTELSGSTDIWLNGRTDWAGAHVYVYVSTDDSDWQYVYDRIIEHNTQNEPHYVGTTTLTFRYILICIYNTSPNPNALGIDCVTTA